MSIVFADKKCLAEIKDPKPGMTGFRKIDGAQEAELVIFDKGGMERRPKESGGDFTASKAEWVSMAEHRRRKEARSRHWKKIHGPKYFNERNRRESLLRGGRFEPLIPYGGEHPHAFA